jgi:SagB-type dehydrogenase family enzyme
MSVEKAMAKRRSCRRFARRPLTPAQVGQIAWAAQGVSDAERGYRTAPSAGALYPLEVYLVMADGVFHYQPRTHALRLHRRGDLRADLAGECLSQEFVAEAPLDVVFCAVYQRTTRKYGRRGVMYTHIEVGHAGQNVLLQAEAMGLAGVAVGAFRDEGVHKLLALPTDHEPVYVIPVGYPAGR